MPVGSCKYFDKNLQEILNWSDETEEGYFFSVELEYQRHLHDLHNDFPLVDETFQDNRQGAFQLSIKI